MLAAGKKFTVKIWTTMGNSVGAFFRNHIFMIKSSRFPAFLYLSLFLDF